MMSEAERQLNEGMTRGIEPLLERLTHKPVPKNPLRPIIGLRWIGNRYQWWRLLAVIGWIRGVASIPGVPRWQCPL
jgi:hypothetical protein